MKKDDKPCNTYNFDVDFSYVPEFKEGMVERVNKTNKKEELDNLKNKKEKSNE